jgi:tetrahydromethanopterin S-methyltransferase subunit F
MKKFKLEIKWAILFTLFSLVWMLLEKSIGLHDIYIDKHPIYTNLFAIPAIIIFALALNEKKKFYFNNSMTWTQGFVTGLFISILIMIFSPLAMYITYNYITPEYFKNAINYAVENKLMTRETAELYFSLKSYIIQSSIGGLSMGVVTSAIVALFVKTKS